MPNLRAPVLGLQVATPSAPSSGSVIYAKSDGRWYTASSSQAETALFATGARLTSNQATSAAAGTPDTVSGLTIAVPGAGTWVFRYMIFWKAVGTGGNGGIGWKINGPTNTNYNGWGKIQNATTTTSSWQNKNLTVLDGTTASGQATSADAVDQNTNSILKIEGSFTSTASGSLTILGYVTLGTGASAATATFLANSFGSLLRGA
jgi:hypothetical protein